MQNTNYAGINLYEILEVDQTASPEVIKQSFRTLAKKVHPDLRDHSSEALDRMRLLIHAYKTLLDPILRSEHDAALRVYHPRKGAGFSYREFLQEQPENLQMQSKLIFFDLLHHHEEEALDLYERLVNEKHFDLSSYMDREDFMDCSYLMAEEYEKSGNFESACKLLIAIARKEADKPYFKHFFVEITNKLRILTCTKMTGKVSEERLKHYFEQMLMLDLPSRDEALYQKRLAEYYIRSEQYDRAIEYLEKSASNDKKNRATLTLLKRVREQLVAH